MYDPLGHRRIMIGWVPPGVTPGYSEPIANFSRLWHQCSLLRDVRYDSRLQQLTALPIQEYARLRTGRLVPTITGHTLTASRPTVGLGEGRQLDISVRFALPAAGSKAMPAATRLGVAVLTSADLTHRTDVFLSPAVASVAASGDRDSSAWALTVNTSLSGAVPGHANRFPIATQLFKTLPDENFLELRVVLDRSTYCTLSRWPIYWSASALSTLEPAFADTEAITPDGNCC